MVFEVYFDRDGKAVGGTLMMSENVFNILTKKEVIKIYHRMMNRIYETRYYRFEEQDKLGSMWGFLIPSCGLFGSCEIEEVIMRKKKVKDMK